MRLLTTCFVVTGFLGTWSVVNAVDPTWTILKPSNTGLPGDYVSAICLDAQDRPWITAYIPQWQEGGMARHDGDNLWTTISNVDYPAIPSYYFNDIVMDADGIMWIGTDGGLLRYDPDIGPDSFVIYDTSNAPMPTNAIFGIDIDPDGKLWLAFHGVDASGPYSGGLARFDTVTETWDVWTTANGLPWGGEWPGWDWVDAVAVQPDPNAVSGYTVWFSSYELGTATYKDGAFHWFGATWPPADPMTPVGLASDDPVDDDGNLWIVLWTGLAKRSPDGTYTVVGYPAGLSSEVSCVFAASGGRAVLGTYYADVFVWDNGWSYLGNWGGTHTYAFAEESTGAFWIGGNGGAARFADGTMQRYSVTNTGMLSYWVEAIEFGPDGTVYMSANAGPGAGGFDMFDGERWTCVNDFNYGLGPPWGLPSDNTEAFSVRANGNLALGPGLGQGAVDWDGTSYTYLIPQGWWTVRHLAEDGLGRIWAADDYGVAHLVDEQGAVTTFEQGASPLLGGNIGGIIVDENNPGWVYIACGFGISHTNGTDWTNYPRELLGLDQNSLGWHITSMDVAEDGTFWVGSGRGIYHFDPVTSQYTAYTPDNSTLPSDDIDHITIAPDGSVWMTTFDNWYPHPGGVTCFDGTEWTTWTTETSPLQEEQTWSLASRAVPGGYEVWVGSAGQGIAVMTVETAVPGDANGDGVVDVDDLVMVILGWGPCPAPPDPCPADADGSGVVDVDDLVMVILNWG